MGFRNRYEFYSSIFASFIFYVLLKIHSFIEFQLRYKMSTNGPTNQQMDKGRYGSFLPELTNLGSTSVHQLIFYALLSTNSFEEFQLNFDQDVFCYRNIFPVKKSFVSPPPFLSFAFLSKKGKNKVRLKQQYKHTKPMLHAF